MGLYVPEYGIRICEVEEEFTHLRSFKNFVSLNQNLFIVLNH